MAVGYSGFAQIIDGSGNPITLLTTNMGINPELNPINSSSAVGYGWKNAADVSHYANGVRNYRGSLDFDMQGALVWDIINKWALTERVYSKQFRHSPDGTRYYEYGVGTDLGDWEAPPAEGAKTTQRGAWCESFRLSTSQDSTVQTSLGVLALRRSEVELGDGYFDNVTGHIASHCSSFGLTDPLNPSQENISPIPFWKTNADIYLTSYGGQPAVYEEGAETVQWSIDLSNSPQILKTCNGVSINGYGVAHAVVMGPMSVSGSIQLYKHGGIKDPVDKIPLYADQSSFLVQIDAGNNTILKVYLPAVKLESDSYDFNTTSPVFRTFSIKALGGKCVDDIPATLVTNPGTAGTISAPMIMVTEI